MNKLLALLQPAVKRIRFLRAFCSAILVAPCSTQHRPVTLSRTQQSLFAASCTWSHLAVGQGYYIISLDGKKMQKVPPASGKHQCPRKN